MAIFRQWKKKGYCYNVGSNPAILFYIYRNLAIINSKIRLNFRQFEKKTILAKTLRCRSRCLLLPLFFLFFVAVGISSISSVESPQASKRSLFICLVFFSPQSSIILCNRMFCKRAKPVSFFGIFFFFFEGVFHGLWRWNLL